MSENTPIKRNLAKWPSKSSCEKFSARFDAAIRVHPGGPQAVADAIGVNVSTVNRWRDYGGYSPAPLEKALAMADVLGVDPVWLIMDNPPKDPTELWMHKKDADPELAGPANIELIRDSLDYLEATFV